MHAVLLTSATHLSYLRPDISIYKRASMLHLNQTLSAFRQALSESMTAQNADAFLATSILLVHHAWTNVDGFLFHQTSVDLGLDP